MRFEYPLLNLHKHFEKLVTTGIDYLVENSFEFAVGCIVEVIILSFTNGKKSVKLKGS